jgi:hypothetical protein
MAKTKKEQEVKKQTPPASKKTESTTPKKKSNTIWYIIGGIFLVLILIPVIAFFFLRSVFNRYVGDVEETVGRYEQEIEDSDIEIIEDEDEDGEESWGFQKSTDESVDGELEKEDLITDRFPEDIPVSGGIVTSSSYDDWNIEVNLDVDSTVEEILEWYANALEEEGWEITSRSSQESMEGWISGTLMFTKEDDEEERKGRLNADTNPYQEVTSIRLRETL